MKIKLIRITIISFTIFFTSCAETSFKKEEIAPQNLSEWKTLDKGKTIINGEELIIEETEGSNGYFLVSPKIYKGDIILNYKVKAMSEASVIIVLFSVSDIGETLEMTMPPRDAKGTDFWRWRTALEHYNLTFNNRAHNFKPFFFKNETPLKKGFHQRLSENIIETEKWYDVEVGKKQNRLWFKLNNKVIFEQEDCNPLDGGRLMFRISGLNGDKVVFAKIAMKNLVISYQ
ncbi:hypothetical protein [Tenacibaculum xiamenense]|uniref:hypothetical protein n=1 Tax=Tenacibaculum xiamenense TaxID=1261553 RepID=UPI00389535E3